MKSILSLVNKRLLTLAPYEPGKTIESLQRERQLTDIVKLASNENPLGPSKIAYEHAKAALVNMALYPDGAGFELKRALSAKYQLPSSHFTLGKGSDDVLALIVRAFAKPNQQIIISEYGFSTFSIIARANHTDPLIVKSHHYAHDLAAMAKAVTANTSIIMIANPNNPTGTCHDEAALLHLLNHISSDVIVVLDEAYSEYVTDKNYPRSIALQEKYPNLIITRTFSKIYGLAGLRIGYGISHPEIADFLNRIRLPFNANCAGLAAATAVLSDEDYFQRSLEVVNEGRLLLQTHFQQLGLPYLPAYGNFITVDMKKPAMPYYDALLSEGIIVRPLLPYQMPQHLRITIGTAEQNQRLLAALEKILTLLP